LQQNQAQGFNTGYQQQDTQLGHNPQDAQFWTYTGQGELSDFKEEDEFGMEIS